MKILMIGKYPPMQGGTASKTYWLYKHLNNLGIECKIITLNECDYSIKNSIVFCENTDVVEQIDVPWHIPETSLIDDQIVQSALNATTTFKPDLVEINYLWPFCKDALLVSKLINKPLFIRHAGSDIAKFQNSNFRNIMGIYLNHAAAVIT